MMWFRARLIAATEVALALFLSAATTPRVGLYHHHHTGGGLAHVHLDDDDHHPHHHDHQHDHEHHDHNAPSAAVAESPSHLAWAERDSSHWHAQDCFARAVVPAAVAVVHSDPLPCPPLITRPAHGSAFAHPLRARGPPPAV